MASSLLKFSDRLTAANGKKLFWGRVNDDMLPYRGQQAPIYTEEEAQERIIKVADARNAFFDVLKPEENKQYLDVLECCFNGWFYLAHLERFWVDTEGRKTTLHYVEWVEYYLEDGNRTPYTHGTMELSHGQGHLSNGTNGG